jgi:hypothetical protein
VGYSPYKFAQLRTAGGMMTDLFPANIPDIDLPTALDRINRIHEVVGDLLTLIDGRRSLDEDIRSVIRHLDKLSGQHDLVIKRRAV